MVLKRTLSEMVARSLQDEYPLFAEDSVECRLDNHEREYQ